MIGAAVDGRLLRKWLDEKTREASEAASAASDAGEHEEARRHLGIAMAFVDTKIFTLREDVINAVTN